MVKLQSCLWITCLAVLVTITRASIQEKESKRLEFLKDPEFKGLKAYELINEIKVTPLGGTRKIWKRNVQLGDEIQLVLKTKSSVHNLILKRNIDIIHPEFTLRYHDSNNKRTVEKRSIESCHYHGNVEEINAMVEVAMCDGFISGSISPSQGDTMFIKHLKSLNKHIIFKKDAEIRWFNEGGLDHPHSIMKDDDEPMEDETKTVDDLTKAKAVLKKKVHYIELAIVADKRFFERQNNNMDNAINEILKIVNIVDLLYKTVNFRVALKSVELWNKVEALNMTRSAYYSLNQLTHYNRDVKLGIRNERHDAAALISGLDQHGSVVGLAWFGTACGSWSVSVNQYWGLYGTANTIAHEVGHNLHLGHYNRSACSCPSSVCVMNSYASGSPIPGFTDCSQITLAYQIQKGRFRCLRNKPTKLFSDPVCGNGYVEKDEQCDCGSAEGCNDPCCDTTTCQFLAGADCNEGDCCENCKFKSNVTLCKPATTECDLDDHCTGNSNKCLHKRFKPNKVTQCAKDDGYCYAGQCIEICNNKLNAVVKRSECRGEVSTGHEGFRMIANYRNNINWRDMPAALNKMTCNCAKKANQMNMKSFGLQFWGECWASNITIPISQRPRSECKNNEYKPCTEVDNQCVGAGSNIFTYTFEN